MRWWKCLSSKKGFSMGYNISSACLCVDRHSYLLTPCLFLSRTRITVDNILLQGDSKYRNSAFEVA